MFVFKSPPEMIKTRTDGRSRSEFIMSKSVNSTTHIDPYSVSSCSSIKILKTILKLKLTSFKSFLERKSSGSKSGGSKMLQNGPEFGRQFSLKKPAFYATFCHISLLNLSFSLSRRRWRQMCAGVTFFFLSVCQFVRELVRATCSHSS